MFGIMFGVSWPPVHRARAHVGQEQVFSWLLNGSDVMFGIMIDLSWPYITRAHVQPPPNSLQMWSKLGLNCVSTLNKSILGFVKRYIHKRLDVQLEN